MSKHVFLRLGHTNPKGGILTDPNRYLDETDSMLADLYEVYYPPRDEEMYLEQEMLAWVEWNGYL